MTGQAREEKDLHLGDEALEKLGAPTSSGNPQVYKSASADGDAYPPSLSKLASRSDGPQAFPTSILGDGRTPTDRPASPPQNAIICEFNVDDPLKPTNFSSLKKARITALAIVFAILTGLNIGMYTSSIDGLRTGMSGTYSDIEMQLGSTVWLVTVAVSPLALAPFSELYGRKWFYPGAIAIYGVSALGQVYPRNLAVLLVARAASGLAAAVGNSMSAGSLADIYTSRTRGWMMSILSFSIFACMNSSLYIGAVITSNLGWSWVGWITFIVSMVTAVLYTLFLPETRANVILYQRKLRLEKETGREHFAAGQGERMASWKTIVTGSLTRPIFFLTNEPIVIAICVWLGFLWGVAILLLQAVPLVFREYGFSTAQRGLAFLSLVIGAFIAFLGTFHQERLYQRDVARAKARGQKVKPESRLYHAMLGGIAFPVGTLIFAWGGRPSVPWIVPCIGLGTMGASIFPPYLSASIFLADTYEVYSSSAIACQSFSRNFTAGVYALFAKELYTRFPRPAGTDIDMSYALASTLIAAVGLVLGMVPFVLYRFGEYLRLRSRIASEIWASHIDEVERREWIQQ